MQNNIAILFQGTQKISHHLACCRRKALDRAVTVAYADAFGEAGGFGTMSYYLASVFDKACNFYFLAS